MPFDFTSGFPCPSTAGVFLRQAVLGAVLSDEKSFEGALVASRGSRHQAMLPMSERGGAYVTRRCGQSPVAGALQLRAFKPCVTVWPLLLLLGTKRN